LIGVSKRERHAVFFVPDKLNTEMGRHKKITSQQPSEKGIFPEETISNDKKQKIVFEIEKLFSGYNFDTLTFELDVKGKIYNIAIPMELVLRSKKFKVELTGNQLRLMLIEKN
jgi:hypothetical protein